MAWAALWTMLMAAGAVGEDGALGSVPPVITLTAPVAAGSVPTAGGWLTVPSWLVGCGPLAEP
jgi:hypothetical protein